MFFKKAGGSIFGVSLNKAEQKALDQEIKRQIVENDHRFDMDKESMILWMAFLKIIQPHDYKGECGNKPYPPELLLRFFILQNVYNLSGMAVMLEYHTCIGESVSG